MSEQEHSDTPPSGRPNQRNLHSAMSVAKTQDDCSHSSVSTRETVEDQTSGEISESQETTVDARENDEMLLQTLKKELKFHYNKLQRLQPMPWMKRVTVDLGKTFSSLRLMDSQSRRLLREEKALDAGLSTTVGRSLRSDIDVQQIFSPLEFDGSIIPKRILMEGEAGIGKTTLCRKLAYDWRNGEDYIKGFKVVFVIDIRKFKGA
ncbi:NACHT, LRR and PYD domains-containing protein 3-like [Ptychodera flava]|uniref:NACHT, LRR and PYD domains-containing protein 3-like n=1 Tax=Ptychodera flava TaxID=63121 RepID=UPI003969DAB9